MGFGRACTPLRCAPLRCAPLRCVHLSFELLNTPNEALRAPPPIAASLLLIYPPKLSLRPELVRQGRLSFHWAKLHPTELHCILLSYAAPS